MIPSPYAERPHYVPAMLGLRIAAYRAASIGAALLASSVTARLAGAQGNPDTVVTRFSGLLQADSRLVSTGSAASGPIVRRAQFVVEVRAPRGFELRLQPDFGQGRVLMQDAYARWRGTRDIPRAVGGKRSSVRDFDARVGRFRPTFGTERLRPSATLLFPERGLTNSYVPGRAFGAELRMTRGRAAWAAGVFQATLATDEQTVDTDGDLENAPPPAQEVALRFEWWFRQLSNDGPLRAHAGFIAGRAQGRRADVATQPSRILTIGQQTVFAYSSDPADPVLADGGRWRAELGLESVGARVAWHVEAMEVEDGIRRQAIAYETVRHVGLGAGISVVHGGQRLADYRIVPSAGRGALEWGLRAGAVSVGDDAVARFGAPGSVARAANVGVALGWLPTAFTRFTASYDIMRLGRSRSNAEHAFIVRVQQQF